MTIEKAHQAIGAYFCNFSALERELGETVKVVFRLQQHEAADTIIAALGDFARKANLIGAAVKVAKNMDGSETTEEWKTKADTTIGQILGCNNPDRTMLAHWFLEPNADASVKLTPLRLDGRVLRSEPKTWAETDFQQRINQLRDLTLRLQKIKNDLSGMSITMGWMIAEPHLRAARSYAGGAILNSSGEDWLAPLPRSTNEDKRD